jgi:predicted transcriptional regulator
MPLLDPGALRRLKFWVWFHDGERLPVVAGDQRLIGSIAKTDVILALAGSTKRPSTNVG